MKISKNVFFGTTSALGLSVLYSYYRMIKISDNSEDIWVGIKGTEKNLNYVSWFLAATSYLTTYYHHYTSFNDVYQEKDKRNLMIIYSGILGFSALWGPYTANFINKINKYKKVKNKNLYKKQGVAFILTMVTLFSFLHLRFTILNVETEDCKNNPNRLIQICLPTNKFFLAVLSNIYFLFHVGVVDNILWLRKFWKKY